MSETKRGRERGFALLLIFVLAASVAISLYTQLPRVAFEMQREKEETLIERGEQYKRAIQIFVRKNKRYPTSMEELEGRAGEVHFLRRKYIDPMTGEDEWRLIHVGPNGQLLDSVVQLSEEEKKKQEGQSENTFISELPTVGSTGQEGQSGGNPFLRQRDSDKPGAPGTGGPVQGAPEMAGQQPYSPQTGGYPGTQQPNPYQQQQPYPNQQPYANPAGPPPNPGFAQVNPPNPFFGQTGVPAQGGQAGVRQPGQPQVVPGQPNVTPGQPYATPGQQPFGQQQIQMQQMQMQQGYQQPDMATPQASNAPQGQQPALPPFLLPRPQTQGSLPGGSLPGGSIPSGQVGGNTQQPFQQQQYQQPQQYPQQQYVQQQQYPQQQAYQQQLQQQQQQSRQQPDPQQPYQQQFQQYQQQFQQPQSYQPPAAQQPSYMQRRFQQLPYEQQQQLQQQQLQQQQQQQQQQQPRTPPGSYPVTPAGQQNPALKAIQEQLTRPRPGGLAGLQGSPGSGGQTLGGGIAGVASKHESEGIKVYRERTKYNEWEFIYDPKEDKTMVGSAAGQQQQQQGQGRTPGPLSGSPSGGSQSPMTGPNRVGPGTR